ncbi:glycosyltransferase family 9 protein [Thermodesulfovibrio sp. N1]|jgi:ADP-heptose:LPS heptosyltransferase|uniref:glycosyltransferase family 9 protein n=1 Tax=Thermodesulfovibrio sp. N1 TaxID=1871110 RepID=UPI00083A742F|nr:glycosyltransferase family 9 protein [Thermodesulfovibrio sp. N1]
MKALVYRMGGLGDSILVYPVLEILKRKGYEITVWGNPEYFRLAIESGFCKKATFYEPKEEFNLKIIFSQNKEILNSESSIYIKPIPTEKIWIVEHYLRELSFQNESFSRTLPIKNSIEKHRNLCIVHPGSGSKKKNPELSFFIKLEKILRNRGFKIQYLLGPAEKKLTGKFKNFLYMEDTLEIAKILFKANLYIGLDSGISHLSSFLGIPSIIIFGPTDPLVWHPIGENFFIIREENCPPCFPNVCEKRGCLNENLLIEKISLILKKYIKLYLPFPRLSLQQSILLPF